MVENILYRISSEYAQVLNLYFNEMYEKFPFKYFSIFESKRKPKAQIRLSLERIKNIASAGRFDDVFKPDFNKSIERNIILLSKYYTEFVNDFSTRVELIKEVKESFKFVDIKNLYGISSQNKVLHDLIQYLYRFREYFLIILLNGSIGSRDYKPGWSDIDLFIIIKNQYLNSKKNLKKIRKITLKINRYLKIYSVLQLHGVFFSSEDHMLSNYNEFFPITCLNTGQVITNLKILQFLIPNNIDSSLNYYKVVSNSFRDLYFKSKVKQILLIEKIRLFHRIYSFPFTFLQCLNINIGKKESFDQITEFSKEFPKIKNFYKELNKLYWNWRITKLSTLKFRRFLSRFFSLNYLNKLFRNLESDIVKRINKYFNFYLENGFFEEFIHYLDHADNYLEEAFPEYKNEYKPYLKKTFYERTLEKVSKIFSNYDEIYSIYQFGSIHAPGNSDVDLIFVIKDDIPLFNRIIDTFKTKFTQDERFIIYQHSPFVIPLELAPNLNFLLPCSNLIKIYGKSIEFKKVENPYTKLAIFIELLIFTSLIRIPKTINKIEDLVFPLQKINTIKHIIGLYLDLEQEFSIERTVDLTPIYNVIEKNDALRKNMYFYDVIKIISFVNNSVLMINKFLFELRITFSDFIEEKALNNRVIKLKKQYPIFKFGEHFFVSDKNSLNRIYNKKGKIFDDIKRLYQPWSFYFFFQTRLLKKPFYEGNKKRISYINKFLNYTSHFNDGNNLYMPFWYYDLNKPFFSLLWDSIPKQLRKKKIVYFYLWQTLRSSLIKFWKSIKKEKIRSLISRIKQKLDIFF
jgi:predicted nucleotidyltransferase